MTLRSTAHPTYRARVTDTFCFRLTLAILYRAGLDALDETSFEGSEAREFLKSDFARLALKVLLSSAARDIDFGDTSDYLGHFQRISTQRNRKSRPANKLQLLSPQPVNGQCTR